MDYNNGVIEIKDFGKVIIKINQIMNKKGITIYKLSKLTCLKHQTIKAYYENKPLTRVDTEILAKMCYVLNCNINDILEYHPPKKN